MLMHFPPNEQRKPVVILGGLVIMWLMLSVQFLDQTFACFIPHHISLHPQEVFHLLLRKFLSLFFG